ncbi:hypothetical protein NDU88_006209 [Pleurodeles waltl]|uniref:Uncharacterized protein n=1 Tax=Pleurodeles waltl TaxID=8319 RepID=A0AAV7L3G0_PLEWA|nr:hypothetical protein NDU88_006209 [Pleurodeles waltl]
MRYKPDWKRRKEVTVLRKGERLPGEDRQKKHMEKPTVTVLRKGERLPGEDRQKKHMEKPTQQGNAPRTPQPFLWERLNTDLTCRGSPTRRRLPEVAGDREQNKEPEPEAPPPAKDPPVRGLSPSPGPLPEPSPVLRSPGTPSTPGLSAPPPSCGTDPSRGAQALPGTPPPLSVELRLCPGPPPPSLWSSGSARDPPPPTLWSSGSARDPPLRCPSSARGRAQSQSPPEPHRIQTTTDPHLKLPVRPRTPTLATLRVADTPKPGSEETSARPPTDTKEPGSAPPKAWNPGPPAPRAPQSPLLTGGTHRDLELHSPEHARPEGRPPASVARRPGHREPPGGCRLETLTVTPATEGLPVVVAWRTPLKV